MIIWSKINDKKNPKPRKEYGSGGEEIIWKGMNLRTVGHDMEITMETIYEKVLSIEQDLNKIKKILLEEPELRDDFIRRINKIDSEQMLMVKDFGKHYGLR